MAGLYRPGVRDRAPGIADMGNGRVGMCVEDQPITKQDGSYPMHSKEFLEAAARGMEKHEKARAAGFLPQARLADMDRHGVDVQVLYPTVGGQILGKEFVDPELLAAVCAAYNDWSREYCNTAARRLRWAAMLPMQAPDLAVEEARRAAANGAACFYVRPNPVRGRNLHHDDNGPVWSAIEDLRLPVCIHDSGSPYLPSFGDRMETHTSGHILAHPFEAMAAMTCLIWFGVIERHPGLKVVHVEADGGWLPYWLQRMEQHWEFSGNAEHPLLKRRPTEYFKSNFLVACRGDEMTLPAVCESGGRRLPRVQHGLSASGRHLASGTRRSGEPTPSRRVDPEDLLGQCRAAVRGRFRARARSVNVAKLVAPTVVGLEVPAE